MNVAHELANQWFDDFYHPTNVRFTSEFSTEELALLKRFDACYETQVRCLPDSLDELIVIQTWNDVMAEAQKVLDACGWYGLVAQYEVQ